MKIKTIFKINIALIFIQAIPLILSLFNQEILNALVVDAFGESPSPDAVKMFETFCLVLG